MQWFYFKGNDIYREYDAEKFIRCYGGIYYLLNDYTLEQEIDGILKNGIHSREEAVRVLQWKFGNPKPAEEENGRIYVYNTYGSRLDVTALVEIMTELAQAENLNDREIWDALSALDVRGFGAVYMVNVLYFLTKGSQPIFDKFAYAGLFALLNGLLPGETATVRSLPNKGTPEYRRLVKNARDVYWQYRDELYRTFGARYFESRDVDRALWTYGHLFIIESE